MKKQSRSGLLTLPSPSTNFETQKYHQNKLRFNGVCSINNLPKIENGAYLLNLDEYKSMGNLWWALYVNGDNVTYSDRFGVEYIRQKLENL